MKKIYLIILLATSFNLFSLDHGLITGVKTGYIVAETHNLNGENIYRENDFSLQIKLGYRLQGFRILGTYESTMEQHAIDSYIPIQDLYTVDISYQIKDLKIGFTHYCDHPVVSQMDERSSLYNGGKRSFYISYYHEF